MNVADLAAAREIVVETWLNAGYGEKQLADHIQAVRDGKRDNDTCVQLALAGIHCGRGIHQTVKLDTQVSA